MNRIIIFIVLVFITLNGLTQELNRTVKDEKTGKDILIGECDREGLQSGEFGTYYKEYYQGYQPEKSVMKEIRGRKSGVDITIILGTWCHDSKEQVPRFYKILKGLKWKDDHLKQYCVNTSKVADSIDLSTYDVVRVPTFIFSKNDKELGRIIETPVTTLEKDMLMILK